MAYQKKMAIRDYLAIFLRSKITRSIQKTMAIDRKQTCITIIATGSRGSRQDRGRIARIAGGSSKNFFFLISRPFMLRFANGFQQNDGNTLLSTVLMSYKAQIYFFSS